MSFNLCTQDYDPSLQNQCTMIINAGGIANEADLKTVQKCALCPNTTGAHWLDIGSYNNYMGKYCSLEPTDRTNCPTYGGNPSRCSNLLLNTYKPGNVSSTTSIGEICRNWRDDPCMALDNILPGSAQYSGTHCDINNPNLLTNYDTIVTNWCDANLNNWECNCLNAKKDGHHLNDEWEKLNKTFGPDGANLPEKCWWKWCRKDYGDIDSNFRQYLTRDQLCQTTCCDTCSTTDNELLNTCGIRNGGEGGYQVGSISYIDDNVEKWGPCCPALPACSNIVVESAVTGKIDITQNANCSGQDSATYWALDERQSPEWPCRMIRECDTRLEGCPEGVPPLDNPPIPPVKNYFTMAGGYPKSGTWGPGKGEWACKCCQLRGDDCGQHPECSAYCNKDSCESSLSLGGRNNGNGGKINGGKIFIIVLIIIGAILFTLGKKGS